MKNAWNVLTNDLLFAIFMRDKYLTYDNVREFPLISSTTKTWKEFQACLKELVNLSTWEIGNQDINLLCENWSGQEVLLQHLHIVEDVSINEDASRGFL